MSNAENCILAAVNRVDAGVLTAGSTAGALAAANLQDRQITKVWRSTGLGAAQTWVQCDFGKSYILDLVALIGANISQYGTWRVRLGNDPAWGSVEYDSGAVRAWPIIGGFGSLPWGVWAWGDILPEEEAALYTFTALCMLPEQVVARYLRIDIDDPSNAAGYVQAGRLLAGPAYRPTLNMDYGWQNGWIDDSRATYSRGGQAWIDEARRKRVVRFSLSGIDEGEIYANVFDFIDRRKGIAGDVLFIPQPKKPEFFIHEVIYGRLQSLAPIVNPAPGPSSKRSREFEIEELL